MAIVFVHGVNVRREGFEVLKGRVERGVTSRLPNTRVHSFYWGDLGASLRMAGASIPGFLKGTRAVAIDIEGAASDASLALLLLEDPLIELRALKDHEEFDPAGAGFMPIPAAVKARNRLLEQARTQVADALVSEDGTLRDRGTAQDLVNQTFRAASGADRSLSAGDLIDPLTRALTASLFREFDEETHGFGPTSDWTGTEERVAAVLESALGGQRSWIGDRFKRGTLRVATGALRLGLRRRIMSGISLFLGDLLVYLSNKDEIQSRLDNAVETALREDGEPLILIAHSLGGLIAFHHVVEANRPVERFLTVGSQPGLFTELGVLDPPLRPDRGRFTTPEQIKEWVNVYDPDDILSFLVEPVFHRCKDVELNTRAPFPICHSEYWNLPDLYERLFP